MCGAESCQGVQSAVDSSCNFGWDAQVGERGQRSSVVANGSGGKDIQLHAHYRGEALCALSPSFLIVPASVRTNSLQSELICNCNWSLWRRACAWLGSVNIHLCLQCCFVIASFVVNLALNVFRHAATIYNQGLVLSTKFMCSAVTSLPLPLSQCCCGQVPFCSLLENKDASMCFKRLISSFRWWHVLFLLKSLHVAGEPAACYISPRWEVSTA